MRVAIGWFKTELIIVMCPLQIDKSLHLKYICDPPRENGH